MAALATCQDHHWVPFDKMGPLPPPGIAALPESAPAPAPAPYSAATPASPMAPAAAPHGQAPSVPPNTLLFAGVAELGSGAQGDLGGYALYIIARKEGERMPLAAIKRTGVTLPYSFTITGADIMMTAPDQTARYRLEARLDKDGSIDTRHPEDLMGIGTETFPLGATNARVILAPAPKS